MPKQSSLTVAGNELKAFIALNFFLKGDTQYAAAEKAGITVATLQKYIAESDIAKQVQTNAVEAERMRLTMILSAQNRVLEDLVQQVMNPNFIDPEFKLKFLKYLDSITPGLFDKLGLKNEHDEAREYSMNGPATRQEESKLMSDSEFTQRVDIKALADGSVNVSVRPPARVIDATPSGQSQEEEFSPPSQLTDLP